MFGFFITMLPAFGKSVATFFNLGKMAGFVKTVLLGFILYGVLVTANICAQTQETDSIKILKEVTVTGYEPLSITSRSATAVSTVQKIQLKDFHALNNPVAALNTIAGVRMEERSPGSYRINIRGSSLRSPFGVRNIKIYWNNLPVTDPGGNSYFNMFTMDNFSTLQVVKGPVSGQFGAGTGGLILLTNHPPDFSTQAEYYTGSFGLNALHLRYNTTGKKNVQQYRFAHQQSTGYRNQSALKRNNFSWAMPYNITNSFSLTSFILLNQLNYGTPGGLTLSEYQLNPTDSRPATATLPSAAAVNASINQFNGYSGINANIRLNANWVNNTGVYGAFNHIKNSAIRNFETRSEPYFGARSVFSYGKLFLNKDSLNITGGAEYQQGLFNINVAGNNNGAAGILQSTDFVNNRSLNLFVQTSYLYQKKWHLSAGLGNNSSYLNFNRKYGIPLGKQQTHYRYEFTPRFSIQKDFSDNTTLQAVISKGFSPPALAELLPSTGQFNTLLYPERGWNYEINAQQYYFHNKLRVNVSAFWLSISDAIVQNRDSSGADFFSNAGSTRQKGLEVNADYLQFYGNNIINYWYLSASGTFNRFKYHQYTKNNTNYSGNRLPGIPDYSFNILFKTQLLKTLSISINYYYNSWLFLNNANTDKASAFNILNSKIAYTIFQKKKWQLTLYAGADNILNQQYGIGHDINAAGGRYFNASPERNFFTGVIVSCNKKGNNP